MRAHIRSRLKIGSAGVAILSTLLLTTAEARLDIADIQNILAKKYPDYQLIKRDEFAEKFFRDHASFRVQEKLKKIPGFPAIAYGDFNHDNHPDFAAVLRGKVKHPPRGIGIYYYYDILIVVCHGNPKSKYACMVAEDKEEAIVPFHHYLGSYRTPEASFKDASSCERLIPPEKDYFAFVPILGRGGYSYFFVKGKYKLCTDSRVV